MFYSFFFVLPGFNFIFKVLYIKIMNKSREQSCTNDVWKLNEPDMVYSFHFIHLYLYFIYIYIYISFSVWWFKAPWWPHMDHEWMKWMKAEWMEVAGVQYSHFIEHFKRWIKCDLPHTTVTLLVEDYVYICVPIKVTVPQWKSTQLQVRVLHGLLK